MGRSLTHSLGMDDAEDEAISENVSNSNSNRYLSRRAASAPMGREILTESKCGSTVVDNYWAR
jgi:hypothetical protein